MAPDVQAAREPATEADAPGADTAARHSTIRPRRPTVGLAARLFSLAMLCAVVTFFGFAGLAAYQACRDSFVAPAILSPDSDVVLTNKLKLSEFTEERARATAAMEGIDSDLDADGKGIARLADLRVELEKSVRWTSTITWQKASTGTAELEALARQRHLLEDMVQEQRQMTSRAEQDMRAGVISRTDFSKQAQTLSQLELAMIDNERSTAQSDGALRETELAEQALTSPTGAPLMPELMAVQEQRIRVELESMKLESDRRSKSAERRALVERIATIDQLTAELKGRPLYRAIEKSLDIAFVPYTQIEGVEAGAEVYSCVWGLFWCKRVGTLAELVPGEVVVADPWGTPARGQYAVLALGDRDSAKVKTLRIRSRRGWATPNRNAESPFSAR
jgi:hypothetical protein